MRDYYYLGGRRGMTRLSTGQMFIVNTDARDIATWIIHLGRWEIFVDEVLWRLARAGDTFIDVGANMGYYTVKVGGKVGPQGRVFAFEPNPDLFDALRDNVRINGFGDRARVFQAAAGEAQGVADLTFERGYPGGGRLMVGAEPVDPTNVTAQTPVMCIDEVIGEDRVDLIKIDVEGFEPMVLKGMARLLARNPGAAVVTEVSYSQWARFGDPCALLREFAGARRLFVIRTDGKIEELPDDRLEAVLNREAPIYILMLPPGPEREKPLRRFIRPYDPAGDGKAPPSRRPGLIERLKARFHRF